MENGYHTIRDKAGLGIELDPDVVKRHLAPGEVWWGRCASHQRVEYTHHDENITRCAYLLLSHNRAGCQWGGTRAAHVSEVVLGSDAHRDRILRGVYPGETGWRWTAPAFALKLDPPPEGKPSYLEMDFTVPSELMEKGAPATVLAKINGAELRTSFTRSPGVTSSRRKSPNRC